MITWITENVAIGEYTDACNRENLLREKIDCVLSLRIIIPLGEPILCKQNDIRFVHIPVGLTYEEDKDSIKEELRTAAYMLFELLEKYNRILVHCTAGMDRAPFVVAEYLAHKEYYRLMDIKMQMEEAYKDIKKKRPQIIEHLEWV